ncbi:hypothetical protein V8C37DRAFT_372968 [Trichoderma ceciliae]
MANREASSSPSLLLIRRGSSFKTITTQENDAAASMAYRAPHDRDRRVYIILHQDGISLTILGVFEELQDANRDCLFQATQADIDLLQASPTTGPDENHISPIEPARWDTADGVSCWVESHTVNPSRVAASNLETR